MQIAVARARALWKDESADAIVQVARGSLHTRHGVLRRASVNRYMACARQMPAHEGDAKERLFGGNAKLRGQVAEHSGDVHVALVRREEDIGRAGKNVLRSINTHAHASRSRNHSTPSARAPVLPPALWIIQREQERDGRHHNCVEIYERDSDDGMNVVE